MSAADQCCLRSVECCVHCDCQLSIASGGVASLGGPGLPFGASKWETHSTAGEVSRFRRGDKRRYAWRPEQRFAQFAFCSLLSVFACKAAQCTPPPCTPFAHRTASAAVAAASTYTHIHGASRGRRDACGLLAAIRRGPDGGSIRSVGGEGATGRKRQQRRRGHHRQCIPHFCRCFNSQQPTAALWPPRCYPCDRERRPRGVVPTRIRSACPGCISQRSRTLGAATGNGLPVGAGGSGSTPLASQSGTGTTPAQSSQGRRGIWSVDSAGTEASADRKERC